MPTPLRILTDQEIQKIHETSLDLLERQGIRIKHDGCRSLLAEHGAKIHYQSDLVQIPADLVIQAVEKTPRQFVLGSRDGQHDLTLSVEGKMTSRNGGGPGHLLDMHTNKVREVTTQDLKEFTCIVDALEHIHYAAPVYAQDTPQMTRDLHSLATVIENTTKHVNMRVLDPRSLPYVIRIAEAVAGGKEALRKKPVISMLESPIAPLIIPDVLVETLDICGEYGIPVELCSMPNLGVTGPVTLAGSLMLSNAEMLAAITISQLMHPGAPLQMSPRLVMMDMRKGKTLIATVELALLSVAGIQLAREAYQIPVNMHGPLTDSPINDIQSAIERTYFTFLSAYAGATVLAGAGHVEQNLIVSIPQLIMDEEIYGMVFRAMDGFAVDEETLGVEAIGRSLVASNFLTDEHTLRNMRLERYLPGLMWRESRVAWEEAGSKDMTTRAIEKADHILSSHTPKPLEADKAQQIAEIIREAEQKII
jgi:trimethylamine--corrinoid protein Co-methyltransferase